MGGLDDYPKCQRCGQVYIWGGDEICAECIFEEAEAKGKIVREMQEAEAKQEGQQSLFGDDLL